MGAREPQLSAREHGTRAWEGSNSPMRLAVVSNPRGCVGKVAHDVKLERPEDAGKVRYASVVA